MLIVLLTAYACLIIIIVVALTFHEVYELGIDELISEKFEGAKEASHLVGILSPEQQKRLPIEALHDPASPGHEKAILRLLSLIPYPIRSYGENAELRVTLEEVMSGLYAQTKDSEKKDENNKG